MTSKDQAIGGVICTSCVAIAIGYTVAMFWPALEAIRLWLVAIPVFIAVLGIGAWIGWTMTTTPLPTPIEELQAEEEKKE